MTDHILKAWEEDIRIRTTGGEPAKKTGYKVEVHEIQPGVIYKDSNVRVTAFVVNHGAWGKDAFGYIFETADRKIVINALDNHNSWAFTDNALSEYKSAGKGAAIVLSRSAGDMDREIVDADGVIGGLSRDQFATAKKLKWVQTFSAGVEAYRWKEFLEGNVALTNCKIVQGPNIADHAMAMLLALTRGLNLAFTDKGQEYWNRDGHEPLELQDMTAVVIGVGGIGSQIAQRAHGFGMKVIGVDPKDLPPNITVGRMVYPSQLDTVLPLADVVFVSAPLTPESRHMMGPRQFDLMKKDSFFVANADYVARMSGSNAIGAFLVDTGGRHTGAVARRIQSTLGSAAQVTDISTVRTTVGSSLTAVDLAGLTRVELGFALVLAAAAGGLVLALGLAERRRSFAILAALGARRRHLRHIIASETLVLTVGGLVVGTAIGWVLSDMLVKVLTGVFDPPPSTIAVPWTYLTGVALIAVATLAAVTAVAVRAVSKPAINVLREL